MTRAALGVLALLLLGPRWVSAVESSPSTFAFGFPIETPSAAAAYRLLIPAAVYQGAVREDLGDVRVFNADGRIVASAVQRTSGTRLHAVPVELPLFPLPVGSRAVADGVRVMIESQGSGVEWRTHPAAAASNAISQYILDGRQVKSAVAEMRLDWPETDLAYSGHLDVEASDDLGSWRAVLTDAPIANLRASGQAILQNRIAFPPTAAPYWRLSWRGGVPPFTLSAVAVQPTDAVAPAERTTLSVAPTHDVGNPPDYWFDLDGHAPVDRINLALSEANTVVTVELSSRLRATDPWRPVLKSQFFRWVAEDGDHVNRPLTIATDRDRYWRARVTSNAGLPAVPFQLQAQWIPEEITFLASGRGPFLLAYGNAAVMDAAGDIGPLPADIRVAPATLGVRRTLGGSSRLEAQAAPFPRMRLALWSTLVAAVAALAWMAFRLSTQK